MAPFVGEMSRFLKGLRNDDDFYDRISHRYTAVLMLVFTVLVSTKTYVGDPIICWVPAFFKGGHKKYANNICWIKNTYYLPFEERIPGQELPRPYIGYYQWVPIVLLLQALMFYVPTIFWRLFSGSTGIDVHSMVKAMSGAKNLDPDKRAPIMKYLVRHIDRYFDANRPHDKECCAKMRYIWARYGIFGGKRFGNYLITLFLSCKVLYLANAFGQLYLLNSFLGTDYVAYGWKVLDDLYNDRDWMASGIFPRVTLCDFKIRQLGGNIHRHTVQCTLPINLFNEKVYMFVWFWLVFVCIATVFGYLTWFSFLFRAPRKHYIRKNLTMAGKIAENRETKMTHAFVTKYLRQDGVFVLKLIGRNSNDVIVSEFIGELWEYFLANKPKMHPEGFKPEMEPLEITDEKEPM